MIGREQGRNEYEYSETSALNPGLTIADACECPTGVM